MAFTMLIAWGGAAASHADCSDVAESDTVDIGPLTLSGMFQTIDGDCSGTPGCGHHFETALGAGDTVCLSTCPAVGGGMTNYDSVLFACAETVDMEFNELTASGDDGCGTPQGPSVFEFTAVDAGTYRLAVGSFGGLSGTYRLAYKAGPCGTPEPTVATPIPTATPTIAGTPVEFDLCDGVPAIMAAQTTGVGSTTVDIGAASTLTTRVTVAEDPAADGATTTLCGPGGEVSVNTTGGADAEVEAMIDVRKECMSAGSAALDPLTVLGALLPIVGCTTPMQCKDSVRGLRAMVETTGPVVAPGVGTSAGAATAEVMVRVRVTDRHGVVGEKLFSVPAGTAQTVSVSASDAAFAGLASFDIASAAVLVDPPMGVSLAVSDVAVIFAHVPPAPAPAMAQAAVAIAVLLCAVIAYRRLRRHPAG